MAGFVQNLHLLISPRTWVDASDIRKALNISESSTARLFKHAKLLTCMWNLLCVELKLYTPFVIHW